MPNIVDVTASRLVKRFGLAPPLSHQIVHEVVMTFLAYGADTWEEIEDAHAE